MFEYTEVKNASVTETLRSQTFFFLSLFFFLFSFFVLFPDQSCSLYD